MATLNELQLVQAYVLQLLAGDAGQPTVEEVAEASDSGRIIEFLIERGKAAGVDTGMLASLTPGSDRAESVAATIASASNAIDPARKYGFPYESNLGYLALSWWIIDQTPQAARQVDLGF